jgi:hypothetical protein
VKRREEPKGNAARRSPERWERMAIEVAPEDVGRTRNEDIGSTRDAGMSKEGLLESEMVKTWREAMANVAPRVWGIVRLKEGSGRWELFERLKSPDLPSVLHPADAPHWRLNGNRCGR